MTTMELELVELKARVEQLEAVVRRLTGGEQVVEMTHLSATSTPTQLRAWLKAEGLIREPTSEEQRLAAEWDALSEAEKQAHIRFMQNLVLDPPLSQIIIENRR